MELNVDNRLLKSVIAAQAWDHILSTLMLVAWIHKGLDITYIKKQSFML